MGIRARYYLPFMNNRPISTRALTVLLKKSKVPATREVMFGYATIETDNYMPLALDIAHALLIELAAVRREDSEIKYLRPDAKSQVTLEYDDNNQPVRIDTIVISTQHDDFDEEKSNA